MIGNWAPGRDYSAVPPPPRLSLDDYLQGILAHDRVVLARAMAGDHPFPAALRVVLISAVEAEARERST